MDWGNIADWANVLVTAIGFAGAVFSFRESKDSDLGVSLSDAKSQVIRPMVMKLWLLTTVMII
ncbi:hypothetical protein [Companilactobacillus nodensis]|uniref:hypothetical protein n=1 Tax=Companilactobacillus nodensis TaxID=460870 RepID=UPI00046928BD|nr:hypothetical protein [Companilactobacillus nodensis]